LARRLFGTDGVRGVAGELLTAELGLALGRAATLQSDKPAPRVLVIRDTRESGEMLEAAVAAGIAAAGGEALLGGVLPTPGAPLLIGRYGLDLGVVISASHNPYRDNGIKFFAGDGFKLDDDTEIEIERALDEPAQRATEIGAVRRLHGALEDYLRGLHQHFAALDLSGRRLLLDCANGATHRAAPEIFRRLGAEVDLLAADPDGRNINDGCGSTHVERLADTMREGRHDAGFAFDGDGDRMLAIDRLPGNGVAVTVMTNFGFHTAMRAAGIDIATTPVGDRYVLEALRERGWALGGEQSGHIIDMGFVPSGDGIAAALLTLEALGDGDLAERHAMEKLPQRLVNVRMADRAALAAATTSTREAIEREMKALEGRGRVLVRPSGTEPLVRVMVEAPSEEEADAACARLVQAVENSTNGGAGASGPL
jgi:phosphoglucosamine mutase